MAKIKGNLVLFSVAGDPVAHMQNVTLSTSSTLAEATDFDSNGWVEYLTDAGLRSWSIAVDGNADLATGANAADLIAAVTSRANQAIVFGPAGAGNVNFTGNVIFESAEITAANEAAVTFSATAQGNGPLTPGTGA